MTDDVLAAALAWQAAGVSVIPIRADKTKRPVVDWKHGTVNYQQEVATEAQIMEWFDGTDYGLAIICGAVSGNLEMLELEGRAFADGAQFKQMFTVLADAGVEEAFDYLRSGYLEASPSGGIHLIYYVLDGDVPGNTKIANQPAQNDEGKTVSLTLVETRGEGGYVIVAPTGGQCHPSGEPWTLQNGTAGVIPCITIDQRNRIHGALHAVFDKTPQLQPAKPRDAQPQDAPGSRPGDEWAAQTPWAEILNPQGWQYSHSQGDSDFWTRPGKDRRQGISAATREDGNLYVWSSSTGLETERPLSKLHVRAFYEFNGDISALAAHLRRGGFGVDRPRPDDLFDQYPKALVSPVELVVVPPAQLIHDGAVIRHGSLRATPASHFKIKRVKWLWEDRAPLGEMTLVPGREGVGKSLLLAALAADITNGRLFGEFFGECRPVFYVASEDSWGHTIAPRMLAAGCNMDLVYRIDVPPDGEREKGAPMFPTDCDSVGQMALDVGAAALMLDPIVSLVESGYDTYKAPELRKVLEPLRRLAEEAELGILALVHFNKDKGGDTSSKIAGSRAWTEVARAAIAIARMPQDEIDEEDPDQFFDQKANRVVVSQIKNNLGRLDLPNKTYEIRSQELTLDDGSKTSVGAIEWGPDTDVSADQVISNSSAPAAATREKRAGNGRAVDIAQFIRDEYASHGLVVSAQEVYAAFPEMKPETVRAFLSRLVKSAQLERPTPGAFRPAAQSGEGS